MIIINLLSVLITTSFAAVQSSSTTASAVRLAQSEYLHATISQQNGDFTQALNAYKKAIELDPHSAYIVGEAAQLALQQGQFDLAMQWAKRRFELAPKDVLSRTILGHVLWAKGDTTGAQKQFEKALAENPNSAESLFALTELMAPTQPKRVRNLLENFLKRSPNEAAHVNYELGRLEAQEGHYGAAVKKLKKAIELDSSQAQPTRLLLAQVYEIMHATASAIAEYEKLHTDDPDDIEIGVRIGELQAEMGNLELARKTFKKIKEKTPNNPMVNAWLASDAEEARDFKSAATFIQESSTFKDDPAQHLRLSYYQIQTGNLDLAMKTLLSAHQRWPQDDRITYYLALGYDDQKQYDSAIELLREIIKTKPDDREARWQLAVLYEKENKMDLAETEFRRLIADNPQDAAAYNYLGYSLTDRGQKLVEAENLIRRAVVLDPQNPAYRDSLGWVLYQLNRSSEAVVQLALAAEQLSTDELVLGHLAEVRNKLGFKESAWKAWRLAQSFSSKNAAKNADRVQKDISPQTLGQWWQSYLGYVHGGTKSMTGVCQVKGKVSNHAVAFQALLTFRKPKDLTFEFLGPFMSTISRAHVDSQGFMMDHFVIEGISEEQLHSATEKFLTAIASILAGEPFSPGNAQYHSSWWTSDYLESNSWKVSLNKSALVKSFSTQDGLNIDITEFEQKGHRRVPKAFNSFGPNWEISLDCEQPKIESEPNIKPVELR